jgi:flavin reductase (DIM6/NTAB) family NADH-FMN oxidoreductase RutF
LACNKSRRSAAVAERTSRFAISILFSGWVTSFNVGLG